MYKPKFKEYLLVKLRNCENQEYLKYELLGTPFNFNESLWESPQFNLLFPEMFYTAQFKCAKKPKGNKQTNKQTRTRPKTKPNKNKLLEFFQES